MPKNHKKKIKVEEKNFSFEAIKKLKIRDQLFWLSSSICLSQDTKYFNKP